MSRFSEFQHSLAIAPNILARRLESFIEAGLMEMRHDPDRAGQHDYVLTDKGRDLGPVVIALTEWGDRWAAPHGPPIRYEHHGCGGTVHHQLSCDICGRVPSPAEVTAQPAPTSDRSHGLDAVKRRPAKEKVKRARTGCGAAS